MLTGMALTIEDIYDIDDAFRLQMVGIQTFEGTDEAWESCFPQTFAILDSLGRKVALIPGGGSIPVTFERRLEFMERAQAFRRTEFQPAIASLKRGFTQFFQASVAAFFTPSELAVLCSGEEDYSFEAIKRITRSRNPPDAELFWPILEQLTLDERKKFVKFATGRAGLPLPGLSRGGSDTNGIMLIFVREPNLPDSKKHLPTAATCFGHVTIPVYDSQEVFLQKVRNAINLGTGMFKGA
jgi:ubiquitin-protein ligase E3 A